MLFVDNDILGSLVYVLGIRRRFVYYWVSLVLPLVTARFVSRTVNPATARVSETSPVTPRIAECRSCDSKDKLSVSCSCRTTARSINDPILRSPRNLHLFCPLTAGLGLVLLKRGRLRLCPATARTDTLSPATARSMNDPVPRQLLQGLIGVTCSLVLLKVSSMR